MPSADTQNQRAVTGTNPLTDFLGLLGEAYAATDQALGGRLPGGTPPTGGSTAGTPGGTPTKQPGMGRPGDYDPSKKQPIFNPIVPAPVPWTSGQKIAAGVGAALVLGLIVASSKK